MPYATRRYGTFLYGEPTTGISGGGRVLSVDLWRASIDNERLENLSDYLVAGDVDMNLDRSVKLAATFTVRDPWRVSPYADYLAAWMRVQYDDGTPETYQQIGLYTTRAPDGRRSPTDSLGTFQCDDLTSVLSTYAYTDANNVAASTNYVTAITATLTAAGINRWNIPATTDTLATAQSFPIGTTAADKCNKLLTALGWYQLGADLDGRISTPGAPRALKSMQPWRTLTDSDLFGGAVDVKPGGRDPANVVIVVNDDATAAPLTATSRNDDPASPTSTVSLGREIVRVEKVSGRTNQGRMDRLAARLLRESRSYYQVATLKLLHDPTALIPHQVVDLNLTGDAEVLNGRWWIRTAKLGLTPGDGLTLEVNRVTDTYLGTEI